MKFMNGSALQIKATIQKMVEIRRIFKFLMGLSEDLDEVRGRILGIKPLPPIREVFSEVRSEGSRKKVMMGTVPSTLQVDRPALAARGSSYQHSSSHSGGNHSSSNESRHKSGRPWCDHCNKPDHVRDKCWRIHGKPADWKTKRATNGIESRGNLVFATNPPQAETFPFNKEQLEMLQKMFGSVQQPARIQTTSMASSLISFTPSSGNVAQTGIQSTAFTILNESSQSWIVDFNASDHMIGNPQLFDDLKPCSSHLFVRIANGSCSKVTGLRSIKVSSNITLKFVLYVSNLNCNLLFLSKLALDSNCVTNFHTNGCVFRIWTPGG
ncbi:uncharacterized protein LOC112518146 [Cynara cardunculus var. scolymus]|uniref:uncharacterized protein LOC112518146 n=1 Tax=Cynara cardunculus var. scolymus TaxID=59895 RepID=UPI000D624E41|nr:uncharacterized protein LOC112518146 [Cynara cardunculus var. scolymus]XP_024981512.1 uncharacterized protein LOC112518146 [Cynara cardunculus var. scolymus]